MPWDETAFQARIMARARERGIDSARELMRQAGISDNTFDKSPGPYGRTYNIIESIAGAVGWTVAEAIGQAWSEDLLIQAVEVALRAVGAREPEMLSAAVVSAYDVLSSRVATGLPIDESALSTLEASLRQRIRR